MFVDFIINSKGQGPVGHGPVGQALNRTGHGNVRFDPGMMRPYFDRNGERCVTINTGRTEYNRELKRDMPVFQKVKIQDLMARGIMSPTFNATTLSKESWIELDRKILRAARYRLRAYADLSAASSFGGFNAMGKTILEYQTITDIGEAIVDMSGTTKGRGDRAQFQLQGTPLPITHSDFTYDARELAISHNTGMPLDTTHGEMAGRRVAEAIEKTTIGNQLGITYGGASTYVGGYGRAATVYGYINFPARLTKNNITAPTAAGWTPATTLANVLAMLDLLKANKFFGPFMLYHSNDFDQYMDNDYILTGGNVATQTLRERLKSIQDITDVRRLDFLFATPPQTNVTASNYSGPGGENLLTSGQPSTNPTTGNVTPGLPNATGGNPFTLLLVQMTEDVAQAINGMDITTLQWETIGGMEINFKVMCIQLPRLRADAYGNCGILHATTS